MEGKYWIYAIDRKGSYLVPIYNINSKSELLNKLSELKEGKFHPKWKNIYRYCIDFGEPKTNKKGKTIYPNRKVYYNNLIELCITSDYCHWDTAVNLIYDCNQKKLYTYDYCNSSIKYTGKAKRLKEWSGKLRFRR